jgi:hypothetical protein
MTSDACRRYFEDPEANAGHLAECAECRSIDEQLLAKVNSKKLRVETLPLAPWEGAGYRSWPLVIGGALTFVALIAALFAAAGASPFPALAEAMSRAIPTGDVLRSFLHLGGGIVKSAPIPIIVLFIAVNVLLIALLRRSPKGIDV